jgi:hypothetical protein
MLQQDFKNLDRLPLQLQPNAISAQLPALRIEFEGAESVGLLLAHGHTTPPRGSTNLSPRQKNVSDRSYIMPGFLDVPLWPLW